MHRVHRLLNEGSTRQHSLIKQMKVYIKLREGVYSEAVLCWTHPL